MALVLVDADDQVAMCQVACRWQTLRWILFRCPPSCCCAHVDAVMNGFVVFARCCCPILFQLRWADIVLDLNSNPSVDVDVVVVVVDAANDAKPDVDAIFLVDVDFDGFVDGLATLYLVDAVVYFVVVILRSAMLRCNSPT